MLHRVRCVDASGSVQIDLNLPELPQVMDLTCGRRGRKSMTEVNLLFRVLSWLFVNCLCFLHRQGQTWGRGGDPGVPDSPPPSHKPAELAHSFLFSSCIYICLYGPFNCISFHEFFPTTLRFLTLFFRSYICLNGRFSCMSLYESLLQP